MRFQCLLELTPLLFVAFGVLGATPSKLTFR